MDFFAAPSDVAAKLVRITEIQPDPKHDFDVPNDVPETPSLDAYEHDARVIPDDEADSAATATAEPTEQVAAKPLELDDPSTWEGLPIPEREWHAETLIPHRTVTLLSGDGGTGKSLLTLQLAVATALGSLWIGRKVAAGRALFLTAEDEMEEVHRRLAGICAAEGARLADLGNLRVKSLADNEDAVLAAPTGKAGLIKGTPLWSRLVASCEEFRPRLLVLDNAADLFAGGENDRAQVRQFIAMLRRLAIRLDMTVLLLSHPSLTGLKDDTGTSGSTAWNNSVRSRLYFSRVIVSDKSEPDPDLRTLKTMKANYGTIGGEIALRWQMGQFVAEKGTSASIFDRMAAQAQDDSLFLELLRAWANQGRYVSSKPGPSYAPSMFAKDPGISGTNKRALEAAMHRLFAARRIRLETFGSPSRPVIASWSASRIGGGAIMSCFNRLQSPFNQDLWLLQSPFNQWAKTLQSPFNRPSHTLPPYPLGRLKPPRGGLQRLPREARRSPPHLVARPIGCSEKVARYFPDRGRAEGNARRRRIVSYDNCQRGDPMSSAARHRKADR